MQKCEVGRGPSACSFPVRKIGEALSESPKPPATSLYAEPWRESIPNKADPESLSHNSSYPTVLLLRSITFYLATEDSLLCTSIFTCVLFLEFTIDSTSVSLCRSPDPSDPRGSATALESKTIEYQKFPRRDFPRVLTNLEQCSTSA